MYKGETYFYGAGQPFLAGQRGQFTSRSMGRDEIVKNQTLNKFNNQLRVPIFQKT